MSTVEEIESAIETLPPEQVQEIAAWLASRKVSPTDEPRSTPGLLGFMQGKITLKPGWDEPLEDFKEYRE